MDEGFAGVAVGICGACGGRADAAEVESAHYTTQGIVRYLRCPCGRRRVEAAPFGAGPFGGYPGAPSAN